MAKLLIFTLIVIGIGVVIVAFIKRAVIRMFNIKVNPMSKSNRTERNNNESKVIYKRDDVVVMKGDAPEHSGNEN